MELDAADPIHSHRDRNLAGMAGQDCHAALWSTAPIECCNPMPRLDAARDEQRFHEECILGCRPAVISGVVEAHGWRAASWSDTAALVAQHGQLLFDLKPGLSVSLARYVEDAASNTADFPFYLKARGDFKGHEALLDDFSKPTWFADDVYDWLDFGGKFRYFLCGGQRTGSGMHTDPLGTCAWNTSLIGHKRWVMFPPGESVEYKALLGIAEEYQKTPPAYWFMDIYPGLKNRQEELGMVEYIQKPGETIFVPAGWWHTVLNLDFTVAVTMNHMLPWMLPGVLQDFDLTSPMFARMLRQELKKLKGRQGELVDTILSQSLTPPISRARAGGA